ncbi:MAG TPA: cellulase family glycosylhydrolase, partial [Rhodopila sp.]|nr:cellulase family glycosylhydrolase [Rhodopila sp.]
RAALLLWLLPRLALADPVPLHRGVNLTNWFRFPASTDAGALRGYIGDRALADLRAAGFDFVRLAVDPALGRHPTLIEAVRRIQRQGLTVIIVPHPPNWHLETSAADRAALLGFWQEMSAALRPLDPARTVAEVLNEPVFPNAPAAWADLERQVLQTIRHNLPHSTVILTGQDWGSIGGLLAATPEPDPDVIYSFHFYDPAELTSLAAYRHDVDRATLMRLPFPVGEHCAVPAPDAPTRSLVDYYCAMHWNEALIGAAIAGAAGWARAHDVHLLAGEFGATSELNLPARLAWMRAVRAALEANGIPWALWGYDDIMGFAEPRPPGPRPHLDLDLLAALGLHTPL